MCAATYWLKRLNNIINKHKEKHKDSKIQRFKDTKRAEKIVQGAKVDRENNLSDILTHCQPSGKFTKEVLQIQQHHEKFSGQKSFHNIVRSRLVSSLRSFLGRVQSMNSLHSTYRGDGPERTPTAV